MNKDEKYKIPIDNKIEPRPETKQAVASVNLIEIVKEAKQIIDAYIEKEDVFKKYASDYSEPFTGLGNVHTHDSAQKILSELLGYFSLYLLYCVDGWDKCAPMGAIHEVKETTRHQEAFSVFDRLLELTIDSGIPYLSSPESWEDGGTDTHPLHVLITWYPFFRSPHDYLKKLLERDREFANMTAGQFENYPMIRYTGADCPDCVNCNHGDWGDDWNNAQPCPHWWQDGVNPLFLALMADNVEAIKLLIAHGEELDKSPGSIRMWTDITEQGLLEVAFKLKRFKCIDYFLTQTWHRDSVAHCIGEVLIWMCNIYFNSHDTTENLCKKILEKDPLIDKLKKLVTLHPGALDRMEEIAGPLNRLYEAYEPDPEKRSFFSTLQIRFFEVTLLHLFIPLGINHSESMNYLKNLYKRKIFFVMFVENSEDEILNFMNQYHYQPAKEDFYFILKKDQIIKSRIFERVYSVLSLQDIRETYLSKKLDYLTNIIKSGNYLKLEAIRNQCQYPFQEWLLALDDRIFYISNIWGFFQASLAPQCPEDIQALLRVFSTVMITLREKRVFCVEIYVKIFFYIFQWCLYHEKNNAEKIEFLETLGTFLSIPSIFSALGSHPFMQFLHHLTPPQYKPDRIILKEMDNQLKILCEDLAFFKEYVQILSVLFQPEIFRVFNFPVILNKRESLDNLFKDKKLHHVFTQYLASFREAFNKYHWDLYQKSLMTIKEIGLIVNLQKFAQDSFLVLIEDIVKFQLRHRGGDRFAFAIHKATELNRKMLELLAAIHPQSTHREQIHLATADSFEWLENKYSEKIKDGGHQQAIFQDMIKYLQDEDKSSRRKGSPPSPFIKDLSDEKSALYQDLSRPHELKSELRMSFLRGLALLWLGVNDAAAIGNKKMNFGKGITADELNKTMRLTFYNYVSELQGICTGGRFNEITECFAFFLEGVKSGELTLGEAIGLIPVIATEQAQHYLSQVKEKDLGQYQKLRDELSGTENLTAVWPAIVEKVKSELMLRFCDLKPQDREKLSQEIETTNPEWIDFKPKKIVEEYKDFTDINVPNDGDCLFWAVMLAVLLPVLNTRQFDIQYERMFGQKDGSLFLNRRLKEFDGKIETLNKMQNVFFLNLLLLFRQRTVKSVIQLSLGNKKLATDVFEEYKGTDVYEMKMSKPACWAGARELWGIAHLLKTKLYCHLEGRIDKYGEQFVKSTPIHIVVPEGKDVGHHFRFLIPNRFIPLSSGQQPAKLTDLAKTRKRKTQPSAESKPSLFGNTVPASFDPRAQGKKSKAVTPDESGQNRAPDI